MGTRYRYHTHDGGPPGDGIPPGLEPPQGPTFGQQFPWGGPSPFGPPPSWGNPFSPPPSWANPFSPPPSWANHFGPPPNMMCFGGQGPPPAGPNPMLCFPTSAPPSAGPGRMVCFPTSGPPPYTQNPWPMAGPPAPSIANERPPSGAYVNGKIAKLENGQAVLPGKATTFHLILDGVKPWHWSSNGGHRFMSLEVSSRMPFDEFCEGIDAIKKAPYGTPREQIGVQEGIEIGDGLFRAGTAYRLGDSRIMYQKEDGIFAYKTIEQLGWSGDRGKVGRGKPVTIALLP